MEAWESGLHSETGKKDFLPEMFQTIVIYLTPFVPKPEEGILTTTLCVITQIHTNKFTEQDNQQQLPCIS